MRGLAGSLTKLTIFVVVTVFFTAILGMSIANVNFLGRDNYTAHFDDVTMLNPGDDVRIAGVRIGNVVDVRLTDRRRAEVEFDIEEGRELPTEVNATIKFRNLVGQRYLSLEQGKENSSGYLEPGAVIPLERTSPALDLTDLFNGFKPLFQALSPEEVNTLSYEIVQVLQGEAGTVESLLAHTASLTTTIAEKDQVVGEVVDNLNSVLETVNERTPQLSDFIVRLQELVSGLSEDRESIGEAISSLGDLTSTTSDLLEDARSPLRDDIDALGTLVGNLNDEESTVENFIQFLPEKVTKMAATADYGSWFNFYMCETKGSLKISGLMDQPIDIPIAPISRDRCLP